MQGLLQYINNEYLPEKALSRGLRQLQLLKNNVNSIDSVEIAHNSDEIRKYQSRDKISFMIGMEGIEPLHQNLTLLDTFYDLGVRVIGLTHARRNKAGSGPKIIDYDEDINNGLSRFGFNLVNRMNELGILIDTAHINQDGFWDVIEETSDPIINSHSISRSLSDHPRNLTDEQIKAIAESGGLVGVNALNIVYGSDNANINNVIDHIDHIVNITSINNVAVGFDFFDYLYPDDEDIKQHSGVENLNNDSDVSNLPEALENNGYNSEEINKILWENIINTISKI
jgi:membrane dipeptidase